MGREWEERAPRPPRRLGLPGRRKTFRKSRVGRRKMEECCLRILRRKRTTASSTLVDLGRTTSQISLVKRELLLLSGLDIQVSTIYGGRTTELLSKPAWQEVPSCRGLILSESQLGFGVSISNRKDAERCILYDAVLENKRKCRVCVHMCV